MTSDELRLVWQALRYSNPGRYPEQIVRREQAMAVLEAEWRTVTGLPSGNMDRPE
jgi:hypothetical protein